MRELTYTKENQVEIRPVSESIGTVSDSTSDNASEDINWNGEEIGGSRFETYSNGLTSRLSSYPHQWISPS